MLAPVTDPVHKKSRHQPQTCPVRQDQCAAEPRRLAELQRGLWFDQQSVGPVAHAGRLVGRLGRGAGRRPDRHRGGQRHRRLDPQPGTLLRRVGPQAELGRGSTARCLARRCWMLCASDSIGSGGSVVRACGPSSMSRMHERGTYGWFDRRPRLSAS